MYKMLYIAEWFAPFISEWGVWSHENTEGEVWLPLGWENEIKAMGIAFEVRELELPNLSVNEHENE